MIATIAKLEPVTGLRRFPVNPAPAESSSHSASELVLSAEAVVRACLLRVRCHIIAWDARSDFFSPKTFPRATNVLRVLRVSLQKMTYGAFVAQYTRTVVVAAVMLVLVLMQRMLRQIQAGLRTIQRT